MSATEKLSKKFIGAVQDEWPVYSDRAEHYTLGPSIGFGASSIVYAATFHRENPPQDLPCAVKVLDLDKLPQKSLSLLQRETQLMSLSKHPNVLRVRGTWTDGHKLCIATRLMNAGSAADVMRYGWPGGMEEEVIRCILKQALEGLNYLHVNGFLHRDIKAPNLLIDDDGTVLLGDLGVAASLSDEDCHSPGPKDASIKRTVNFDPSVVVPRHNNVDSPAVHERKHAGKRRSFVGTPCWMAPEIINGKRYDSSADIWSFGITAVELSQGRAPRSRESSHKALLQTVQDPPPKLDRLGGPFKYSRAFQEIVDMCLVKDPSQRPTAAQLLQMAFFKGAKRRGYLVGTILRDLPPLPQRQERRRQPSIMTHRTIDSWDFTTTHPSSPSASLSRRPISIATLSSEAVFELDDGPRVDYDPYSRGRAKEPYGRVRAHSRNASYVSGDHLDVDPIIEERISDSSAPPSPLAFPSIQTSDAPVALPTPTQDEAFRIERPSSPVPLTLPPPSQALAVPAARHTSTSLSSSHSSSSSVFQGSSSGSQARSGSVSPSLTPITPRSAGSPGTSPVIVSSPSIWKKLKAGGAGVGSRIINGGVEDFVGEREDGKDKEGESVEKEKKKGFVTHFISRRASASTGTGGAGMMKNALARTTSRTYNAVTSGFSRS